MLVYVGPLIKLLLSTQRQSILVHGIYPVVVFRNGNCVVLTDSFGRTIHYLRVSVTDRCNLFCNYCRLPSESLLPNNQNLLSFEEIIRLVRIFLELGVERIRLTGGEPLLRRNIVALVRALAALPGLQELALSTNALLLARYAVALRSAGLQRVNISLDSLEPETFALITQGKTGELLAKRGGGAPSGAERVISKKVDNLQSALSGIRAAVKAGLRPVKVNMVVMRGINEHEIPNMVTFAREEGIVLRFIETMPVGEAGLDVSGHFMSAEEILGTIRNHFGTQLHPVPQHSAGSRRRGSGPARYFFLDGMEAEVGLISARSRHFCDTCNRMRLTSKGGLVYCLGREDRMDLKTPLRHGATDEVMKQLIREAVSLKPERHEFEQLDLQKNRAKMSALGG